MKGVGKPTLYLQQKYLQQQQQQQQKINVERQFHRTIIIN